MIQLTRKEKLLIWLNAGKPVLKNMGKQLAIYAVLQLGYRIINNCIPTDNSQPINMPLINS